MKLKVEVGGGNEGKAGMKFKVEGGGGKKCKGKGVKLKVEGRKNC